MDPVPLTALAELRALVNGCLTWRLTGATVTWRNPDNIRADRRGGRPIVFADHRCHQPPQPSDVDSTYLPVITRLLATKPAGERWPETEVTALVLLAKHLGARIIDIDAPPY